MSRHLRNPYFLFLLPLFFVLHVCTENPGLISFRFGFFIFLEFSIIALLISFLFRFIVKDIRKAALIGFFIIAFDIFFGSFQDFLLKHFASNFFVRYIFILPATLVVIILLTIYLKRTKKNFYQACLFLNLLFIVLIAMDLVKLFSFSLEKKEPPFTDISNQFIKCDTCSKPDIYMIITDGYAGDTVLKSYFNYDNSAFKSSLQQRGFHVINNPRSNYNFTVYTIASMFSMDYIQNMDKHKMVTQQDIYLTRDIIKKNNFTEFLYSNGYTIENNSFMSPGGTENRIRLYYFPPKRGLFTSQTFVNRFTRNIGYHFPFYSDLYYRYIKNEEYNNRLMDSLTRKAAATKSEHPRFIFSHLIMPHHPYYYDSLGNRNPYVDSRRDVEDGKKDYIQYLTYCNKRLLDLVDTIISSSQKPPIIILMSDHGYRRFYDKKYNDFQFMTLNTVLFPNRNYSGFYDGMSNVNQLRVLLNSQFGQKLPLLKDSTSLFIEP
ncbi:MAG TPA: sulfatase-like hydrolase/transferase [Chitinophagaceae bacterium]